MGFLAVVIGICSLSSIFCSFFGFTFGLEIIEIIFLSTLIAGSLCLVLCPIFNTLFEIKELLKEQNQILKEKNEPDEAKKDE